jgi:hypothetical protein
MKFTADFSAFLESDVNLNQTRIDRMQKSVGAIETYISGHDLFSEIFIDTIPAGSWAHRMIIKPVSQADEFDADVLLYVKEQPDWLPKDYLCNLYDAFRDSAIYKPKAQKKTRCIRIDYAGDFHVDVVPYLERSGSHYVTNRLEPEDAGCFELSDPEAFSAWINECQQYTNNHFIKVVRLLKYLRDFKRTFTCKSIILTTLLGNEINWLEATVNAELFTDVPTTLKTLLSKLAASLPDEMPAIMDPAGTGDNFSDRYRDDWNYTNFRAKMISYAEKVRLAFEEKDREKSIELWQSVFGDTFKTEKLAKSSSSVTFRASASWSGEKFIDQTPFNFPIAVQPAMTVRITARCIGLKEGVTFRRNGFRQFDLGKNGNRVPKNRKLRFTANTNVSQPYKLLWKVRNGGDEAASHNELRGEITEAAEGSIERTETTSYTGTHYVECYIVKNGLVVAKNRQTVIVY